MQASAITGTAHIAPTAPARPAAHAGHGPPAPSVPHRKGAGCCFRCRHRQRLGAIPPPCPTLFAPGPGCIRRQASRQAAAGPTNSGPAAYRPEGQPQRVDSWLVGASRHRCST